MSARASPNSDEGAVEWSPKGETIMMNTVEQALGFDTQLSGRVRYPGRRGGTIVPPSWRRPSRPAFDGTSGSSSPHLAQQGAPLSRGHCDSSVRFVNENLDSKLKWDDIALGIGLDPFSFGRGFKLSTGMTPHQYIIRCRLRRAMTLMAHSDLPLAEIALEVGCSCQSHLTTLFRKHLGTTPGVFRTLARRGYAHMPVLAVRWRAKRE
jgi:AraC-like DNA-binding protein